MENGGKIDGISRDLSVHLRPEDDAKLGYICDVFEESEEEIIRELISEKATIVKMTLAKNERKNKAKSC